MAEIIRVQPDEITTNLWHIAIGGIAADGRYRRGAISVICDTPEKWLNTHKKEAQAIIDDGQHDPLRETKPDFDSLAERIDTEIAWLNDTMPDIEKMGLSQLREVVARLARHNLNMLKAWRYTFRRLSQ